MADASPEPRLELIILPASECGHCQQIVWFSWVMGHDELRGGSTCDCGTDLYNGMVVVSGSRRKR